MGGSKVLNRAAWVPSGRQLHLVDIENLVGGSDAPHDVVRATGARYRRCTPCRAIDHVIVGTGRRLVLVARSAFPEARIRVGSGLDGADLALLDDVDAEDVARRFDRVMIGSGDHIFTPLAAALRVAGCQVTVVVRSHHALSAELRMEVGSPNVLLLEDHTSEPRFAQAA